MSKTLSSSSSHSFISNTATLEVFAYLLLAIYRISQLKFLESSIPLEKTSIFSVPWDFKSRREIPKIKLYSVRALKGYLNEKNLIHGGVTGQNDFKI